METNNISIIICCYNSAHRLHETIKHLALQQVAESTAWELIIVNNNSTDNTLEVARNEINQYEILQRRSKIVNEKTPGLSYARSKGVQEAQYEYIVFCDDDNWLDKNYIQTACDFLNNHKNVAAVGGQSEGVSEVQLPDWWEDYKWAYAVGKQGQKSGDITEREFLWGSGLAFRKSLYVQSFKDYPSFLSDRKGNELSSGGDSEVCMRFILMGYQLYYDESLMFKHFIDPQRLNWTYLKKLTKGFLQSASILKVYSVYIEVLRYPNLKYKIFLLNYLKVFFSIIFNRTNFYTEREANLIYFTSGITLRKTSETAKSIKELYQSLKHLKR